MLLHRSITLANGRVVRLRLPLAVDRQALRELYARLERPLDDMELSRLMRHDPRRRAAVCATCWIDGQMQLVGYAAGDVGAEGPDVLAADETLGPDLGELLRQALAERTGSAHRPHVA